MGYRLMVAVLSLVFVCSCAAFDKDTDAIEGFGPDKDQQGMPSVVKDAGVFHGYYQGAMTLDSNTCQSISDEVGTQSRIEMDVLHKDDTLNVTFADKSVASGKIEDGKTVFATNLMGVEHVYYLTFSEKDNTVKGSCEVLEADEDGVFAEPCASYTVEMEKGEKPEEDEAAKKEDEKKE